MSGALDQAGQAIDTPNTDVPELGTAPNDPAEGNPTAPLSPVTDTLDSTGDSPLAPVTDLLAPPASSDDSGSGLLAPVTDLVTPVTACSRRRRRATTRVAACSRR